MTGFPDEPVFTTQPERAGVVRIHDRNPNHAVLFIECTGTVEGTYEASAGSSPYTDNNWILGSSMLWGELFPEEPNIRPIHGSRSTANVHPLAQDAQDDRDQAVGHHQGCSKKPTKTVKK
ncbi:hypothetical protein [Paeniglutamicibacter kerguelensis]|uniref:Uncharacterized protein n=1 Tax=Paeniglutamicibacter kerguelensis TaxID=254788 RepID=A0ABS4XAQ8_9MICC|nr:hypothetical protein [Paeniglutamicibacter kerguelensis]MBP2385558.1 hypothetical protein [Paeniglutamicibacter kerguelensis]